jgi:ATP-dependent DNA helicase RecG
MKISQLRKGGFSVKETKTLEYKKEITNTFLKTVSAYANYGTGRILFGIDDNGRTVGMQNPEQACLDIENKINDSIQPKPDFSLKIDSHTQIVELTVSEGIYKPYLYKGKAYRRSDTATVEIDQLELKRLILEGQNRSFEELAYTGPEQLTFQKLKEKLQQTLDIKTFDKDILRTLGFFTSQKKYNNAGGLAADQNHFPGLDVVRFGHSINEIRERHTIKGKSVLSLYEAGMNLFDQYYRYEIIQGDRRVTRETIPKEAFRETLANAIVHRQWDIAAPIKISLFPNQIEIVSPGGLPSGLTEKEYLEGTLSLLRNPILGSLFYRLHLIEMFGTGIRRIRYMYEQSVLKPKFTVYQNSIQVVLPAVTDSAPMSTDEKQVYTLLTGGKVLTSREISEALSMNKSKALRLLKAMAVRNLIQIDGNGRSTRYRLME